MGHILGLRSDAEIRQKYLQDGSKLEMTDPYIQTLVKNIVGEEKNPFWIAFKIHIMVVSTLS